MTSGWMSVYPEASVNCKHGKHTADIKDHQAGVVLLVADVQIFCQMDNLGVCDVVSIEDVEEEQDDDGWQEERVQPTDCRSLESFDLFITEMDEFVWQGQGLLVPWSNLLQVLSVRSFQLLIVCHDGEH